MGRLSVGIALVASLGACAEPAPSPAGGGKKSSGAVPDGLELGRCWVEPGAGDDPAFVEDTLTCEHASVGGFEPSHLAVDVSTASDAFAQDFAEADDPAEVAVTRRSAYPLQVRVALGYAGRPEGAPAQLDWHFEIESPDDATLSDPARAVLDAKVWSVRFVLHPELERAYEGTLFGAGRTIDLGPLGAEQAPIALPDTPLGLAPSVPDRRIDLLLPVGSEAVDGEGALQGAASAPAPFVLTEPGTYTVTRSGPVLGEPETTDPPADDGGDAGMGTSDGGASEPECADDDDDVASAPRLTSSAAGRICGGDEDWYWISSPEGVEIELTVLAGDDLKLWVYDGSGMRYLGSGDPVWGERSWVFSGTGPLYARVLADDPAAEADYEIEVR